MNSNPIAWMIDTLDGKHLMLYGSNPPPVFDSEVNAIPLYTHPVKELHLSLQKSKQTGELLAVTYTDDEHRIVEVLWQRPPVKELTDEEIGDFEYQIIRACGLSTANSDINPIGLRQIIKAILRKAQEK